jgi:hypothetical protein
MADNSGYRIISTWKNKRPQFWWGLCGIEWDSNRMKYELLLGNHKYENWAFFRFHPAYNGRFLPTFGDTKYVSLLRVKQSNAVPKLRKETIILRCVNSRKKLRSLWHSGGSLISRNPKSIYYRFIISLIIHNLKYLLSVSHYMATHRSGVTVHISVSTVQAVDQDSAVGTTTCYGLDSLEIESLWGRDFPHPSRPPLGPTQPPTHWIPGLFFGVKRSERGVDHPLNLALRLKKIVELYLYSPFGSSWSVLGWTLPLPLPLKLRYKNQSKKHIGYLKDVLLGRRPSLVIWCFLCMCVIWRLLWWFEITLSLFFTYVRFPY